MWIKLMSVGVAAFAFATLTTRTANAVDEIHEGEVIAVGSDTIAVLDRRDNDNDKFIVTPETKITHNGKPAKLSQIQAGDLAKVTATQKADKLIAKSIEARSPE